MRYFLKKSTPSKKGLYLQIYQSCYIPGKGGRNKSFKVIGYFDDLVKNGISDPIKYAQDLVDDLNKNIPNKQEHKIGDISLNKNLGYFLLKSIWNYLDISNDIDIMTRSRNSHFKMSDFILSMISAQVVNPGSKHNAFEKVIPSLYSSPVFSYDQILDAINFIGDDYQKYIEVINYHIEKMFSRNTNKTYFDCTNYYFEIDLPKGDRQFGPCKEERHLPIIGQALLLDENQIPLGMSLYPGNQSEKPEIRNSINNLKSRFNIDSKIVQVADKGLNCARNIYAASIEANDGYIFSKSIHGKNLSKQEKEWVLLDNENNVWTEVNDINGKLIYKYKECIDTFEYKFINDDGLFTSFKVKEKRIVSFNPNLAKKQIAQIQKQIDKALKLSSIKQVSKSEYGDSVKYVSFISSDDNGEAVDINVTLNQDKIDEDLKLAGFNLLVTSEINKSAEDIYNTYHGLWRIEESFRITKTQLQARPVYLQKQDSIYGHFLICYISLLILRLLELKVFNDILPVNKIVEFIRDFKVTQINSNEYISTIKNSFTLQFIKEKTGLSKLDNLHLSSSDIFNFFDNEY